MEEYSKNVTKRYDCDVSEGYWIYKEYCENFFFVLFSESSKNIQYSTNVM